VRAQLAWDLVDHCRGEISGTDLQVLYVILGAGDYDAAIVAALNALYLRKAFYPGRLHPQLTEWVTVNALEPRHLATPAITALKAAANESAQVGPTRGTESRSDIQRGGPRGALRQFS
jgi:hypothetical protein